IEVRLLRGRSILLSVLLSGLRALVPGRVNLPLVLRSNGVASDAAVLSAGVDVSPVARGIVGRGLDLPVELLVAEVAALLEGVNVEIVLVLGVELGLGVAGVAQVGVHLGAVHLVGALSAVGADLGEGGGVRHGSHLSVSASCTVVRSL